MATKDFITRLNSQGTIDQSKSGYSPEVQRLSATIVKQKAKLGQTPNMGSPSILDRVFDVVSRPLYTSANIADSLVTGKSDPVTAAWRGLSGQDKTTYDKVLGDMGFQGGFQRSLAGFGLDILLDPTTYVGLGTEKGLTEGAARQTAVETATGVDKTILNKAAADAVLDAQKNSLATTGQALSKVEKGRIGKQAISDHLVNVARTAEDKALQNDRGKVFLKMFGKKVPGAIPAPVGEGIYGVGTKLSELATKSPALVKVGQALRPVMNFKQGTNNLLREATGHAVFDGEEYLRQLKTEFGHLGVGERQQIFHAIEGGDDLSKHVVTPKEITLSNGTKKTFTTLEDYKQHAIDKLDALFHTETGMGIIHPKSGLVNYVPHIYDTADRDAAKAFKAERQKLQSQFLKGGNPNPVPVIKSAKEASAFKHLGQVVDLKPETDIMQAMGNRAISSFREQGQVRFANAVEHEFGVNLGAKIQGKVPQREVENLAKSMNLVEGKSKYLSDKGIYFHPDVAKALKTVDKVVTDPAAGAQLFKTFDKIQNIWKLNMTALNPGHHIRNFAGDVFLNFEDGVVNPARYSESAQILKNWREAPDAVHIMVGGRRLNAQEVMDLFASKGGKSGFFRSELVSSGIKPVEKIREMAEVREDWTRLAHFVDVLKKEGKNVKTYDDLDKVASEAGRRVRKFNIDYGDLTPAERNGMKRVVPFYTWMRKNIPVQLETLALQPGKVNAIPKFMKFLNTATGQSGQDPNFLGLNLTPLWLRQMASVRVAGEGQGRNGVYWEPSVIPFTDIGQYTEGGPQGIISTLLGTTSPFIRTPIEYATGRSLQTGGPLQDSGMGYAGANILPPTLPRVKDILTGQSDMTDVAKLLGISLQNVGDSQMSGELRRQQDPLQIQIKNLKKKAIADYQKAHPGG